MRPGEHRKPPPYPRPGPWLGLGWCVFCGDRILPPGPDGKLGRNARQHPHRCRWHYECLYVYRIAVDPEVRRKAVFERDGGICAICGTDTYALHAGRLEAHPSPWWLEDPLPAHMPASAAADMRARYPDIWGPWTGVRFATGYGFEVDHVVPLWKAPREWRYWGLENLATTCSPCHKRKSGAEARERAAGPPSAWSGAAAPLPLDNRRSTAQPPAP